MESHRCPQTEEERWLAGRAERTDPGQTGRLLNSRRGLMGNLAALLIVSLICCFLQIKGKQAEQAEVIAFPSEDKSGSFCNYFWHKDGRRDGI